jgi:ribosomal protein S18 acetylase RimI-like enzyme
VTEPVSIRDARDDELDEVGRVTVEAYRQYLGPGLEEVWASYELELADAATRRKEADVIVAEHGGRIVGAVAFYTDGSGATGHQGRPREWAGIRFLAVHPEARGLGIGRGLTDECLRRARERGVRTVGLHTSPFMEVAVGMYERLGFARAPEYDFYPTPDIVATAYRLDL